MRNLHEYTTDKSIILAFIFLGLLCVFFKYQAVQKEHEVKVLESKVESLNSYLNGITEAKYKNDSLFMEYLDTETRIKFKIWKKYFDKNEKD